MFSRQFDPNADILAAEWHPLKPVSYLKPLLIDLSDWRNQISEMAKQVYEADNTGVAFIADFPGLKLENYIQPDLANSSLTVLKGEAIIELVDQKKNVTVKVGDKFQVKQHRLFLQTLILVHV